LESLSGIEIFVHVGRLGSFVAAAKYLQLSPSAVSKAISRLEERLNTQLIVRTTRALTLTDDGNALYERANYAVTELHSAQDFIVNGASEPRGTLRVSMPVLFGASHIAPLLPKFIARYPQVKVLTHSTDSMSDLVNEGFDILIRTGELADSDMIARKLLNTQFVTCAAPDFIERMGEPTHPDELIDYQCCCYVFPSSRRIFKWPFSFEGNIQRVDVDGALHFSHADAMIQCAIAGGGLIHLQDYMLNPYIEKGLLRPVLSHYQCDGGPISAVYLRQQHLSPKIRVFVDWLKAELDSERNQ
jgi:DNA-binding transcriptional LysR family regulator